MTARKKAAAAAVIDEVVVWRYWMVHGMGAPTVKHPTKQDAVDEAQRLAKRSPDSTFVVLQAVDAYCARVTPPAAVKIATVRVSARAPDDEIPF